MFVWIYDGEVRGVGDTAKKAEDMGLRHFTEITDWMTREFMRDPNVKTPESVVEGFRQLGRVVEFTPKTDNTNDALIADAILLLHLGGDVPVEAAPSPPAAAPSANGVQAAA